MTTFEALSMGVPVVTRYGARHGTRFGLSILQNIGLGELAVSTKEKYIETSVALATETDLLISLRKKLRGFIANSPLSDGAQYAADVESAYETVWADVPKEDKNQ
jgi:predicted O-linked N-acetylglucosamine transferase (SPINDLY family)